MNNRKPMTITVRVEAAIAERLQHLARKLRRSRSSVAGEAIEKMLATDIAASELLLQASDLSVGIHR